MWMINWSLLGFIVGAVTSSKLLVKSESKIGWKAWKYNDFRMKLKHLPKRKKTFFFKIWRKRTCMFSVTINRAIHINIVLNFHHLCMRFCRFGSTYHYCRNSGSIIRCLETWACAELASSPHWQLVIEMLLFSVDLSVSAKLLLGRLLSNYYERCTMDLKLLISL